jgi:ABC-type Fe3+ transport system substrate-binding protein
MFKAFGGAAVLPGVMRALHAADGPETSRWAQFTALKYDGKVATTPPAGE